MITQKWTLARSRRLKTTIISIAVRALIIVLLLIICDQFSFDATAALAL